MAYGTATTAPSTLNWFDRNGRPLGAVGEPAFFSSGLTAGVGRLRISPDGRQLAATVFDPSTRTSDVWLYNLARGVRTRLTSGPASSSDPVWSPDGRQIIFGSDRKHQGDLYRKAAGGGGEEPVIEEEGQRIADDWSPDGRFLAIELREPKGGRRVSLSMVSLSGDRKVTTYLQRSINNGESQILSGRAMARLYLGGIRTKRGLRGSLPRPGREVAGLDGGRNPAPVAAGRKGALLPLLGPALDVGRDQELRRGPRARRSDAPLRAPSAPDASSTRPPTASGSW